MKHTKSCIMIVIIEAIFSMCERGEGNNAAKGSNGTFDHADARLYYC
jgi:hypothetical protein